MNFFFIILFNSIVISNCDIPTQILDVNTQEEIGLNTFTFYGIKNIGSENYFQIDTDGFHKTNQHFDLFNPNYWFHLTSEEKGFYDVKIFKNNEFILLDFQLGITKIFEKSPTNYFYIKMKKGIHSLFNFK